MPSDSCPSVLSVCMSVLSVTLIGVLWPKVEWIKMKRGMEVGSAPATLC